ncbi:unnamed protein product [Penicillium pancosmium]
MHPQNFERTTSAPTPDEYTFCPRKGICSEHDVQSLVSPEPALNIKWLPTEPSLTDSTFDPAKLKSLDIEPPQKSVRASGRGRESDPNHLVDDYLKDMDLQDGSSAEDYEGNSESISGNWVRPRREPAPVDRTGSGAAGVDLPHGEATNWFGDCGDAGEHQRRIGF